MRDETRIETTRLVRRLAVLTFAAVALRPLGAYAQSPWETAVNVMQMRVTAGAVGFLLGAAAGASLVWFVVR